MPRCLWCIISILACCLCFHNLHAQNALDIEVQKNVIYGEAVPLGKKKPKTLRCDIYRPADDVARPLLITLFGGSFVAGSRDYTDIELFCKRFAQHGYVVATIDYRLMALHRLTPANLLRAGYLGAQDLCTALRFLKGHSTDYGIDTTRVFLLGNSAGSVIILHALFLDEHERPIETREPTDLGPMPTDVARGVTGAVAQWGCVFSPQIIDSTSQTPICLIHGTSDRIVPYNVGHSLTIRSFPRVYGSKAIADRFNSLRMSNYELHTFVGERHCFYFDILTILHLNKLKFDTCFDIAHDFFERCASL